MTPIMKAICIMLLFGHVQSFSNSIKHVRKSQLFYTNSELEIEEEPGFRQRMLKGLQANGQRQNKPSRQEYLTTVQSVEEFKKEVVDDNNNELVVVWFFAPWCRACRAATPGMVALSKRHPSIKFVQVPVLKKNQILHQGLEIPSVPYVHLYHPTGGLVEEQKLKRSQLSAFHKKLMDYEDDSCALGQRDERWSPFSPYEQIPSEK
jgi:thiol-disulfide isomerase/thioredoxin